MEEDEEPEREESMSSSDGECEYSRKETIDESDMQLEDQNEDVSRPRSPLKKKNSYRPREITKDLVLLFEVTYQQSA